MAQKTSGNSMRNVAFVLISTGPFSRTCKAEVCLESMYRVSKYTGKSFLITDSPECHDLPSIRKQAGSESIHIVHVKKFSHRWDSPITLIKRRFLGIPLPMPVFITPMKRPKSKALKAKVFELITDPEIEILIYIDADVVFMREEGLSELLEVASQNWTKEEMRFRVREWDNDEQVFNVNCKIHGGFFIVHREYSKRGLAHWGQIMDRKHNWVPDVTDKEKYLRAYQEATTNEGAPNYLTVRPIPDDFEVLLDPDQANGLIGHITHGRIKHHGKKKIEAYLSRFDLKSYPRGYYTLPGLPRWITDVFFFGYPGYRGIYKIERIWKRIRSPFVKN